METTQTLSLTFIQVLFLMYFCFCNFFYFPAILCLNLIIWDSLNALNRIWTVSFSLWDIIKKIILMWYCDQVPDFLTFLTLILMWSGVNWELFINIIQYQLSSFTTTLQFYTPISFQCVSSSLTTSSSSDSSVLCRVIFMEDHIP